MHTCRLIYVGWQGYKLGEYSVRQPNYKFDWFIPEQIIGLTHFHAAVTEEDIMGVMQKGQELTENLVREFHVLIDNRVINMPGLMSLAQMKQMVPYVNHPQLKWIVVIKPESLVTDTDSLPIEKDGSQSLKNVASLPEALEFLMAERPEIGWERAASDFFPNSEIEDFLRRKKK